MLLVAACVLPPRPLCQQIGFMADVKAGVPRGAYMGTVTVKHHGCRVFIVAADQVKLYAA